MFIGTVANDYVQEIFYRLKILRIIRSDTTDSSLCILSPQLGQREREDEMEKKRWRNQFSSSTEYHEIQ